MIFYLWNFESKTLPSMGNFLGPGKDWGAFLGGEMYSLGTIGISRLIQLEAKLTLEFVSAM